MAKTAKKTAKKVAKKAAKKAAPKKAAKKVAPKKAAKKAAAPKKVAKKAAPKKAAKASPKKAGKRTPNAAFMAPVTPSATLAAVIGDKAVPRTVIVKKIWDYIKKNGLQDKNNKRMINGDDKLKAVFGKPQISMFDLAGIIGKHVK